MSIETSFLRAIFPQPASYLRPAGTSGGEGVVSSPSAGTLGAVLANARKGLAGLMMAGLKDVISAVGTALELTCANIDDSFESVQAHDEGGPLFLDADVTGGAVASCCRGRWPLNVFEAGYAQRYQASGRRVLTIECVSVGQHLNSPSSSSEQLPRGSTSARTSMAGSVRAAAMRVFTFMVT